jgi:hypothetical protein
MISCSASLPRKSKHGHTWPPPRARVETVLPQECCDIGRHHRVEIGGTAHHKVRAHPPARGAQECAHSMIAPDTAVPECRVFAPQRRKMRIDLPEAGRFCCNARHATGSKTCYIRLVILGFGVAHEAARMRVLDQLEGPAAPRRVGIVGGVEDLRSKALWPYRPGRQ